MLVPLKRARKGFDNLPAVIFRKQIVAKLAAIAIMRIKKRPPGLKVGINSWITISNNAVYVNLVKKNILNLPVEPVELLLTRTLTSNIFSLSKLTDFIAKISSTGKKLLPIAFYVII